MERVEVNDRASVEHLYHAVSSQLNIPFHDLRLSKDPNLVVGFLSKNEMHRFVASFGSQSRRLYRFDAKIEKSKEC